MRSLTDSRYALILSWIPTLSDELLRRLQLAVQGAIALRKPESIQVQEVSRYVS